MRIGTTIQEGRRVTMWLALDDGTPREITAELSTDLEVDTGPDPLVVAGLLPAMRLGETLRVDRPVSARLLAGADHIQEVLLAWDRENPGPQGFHRIPIDAEPVERHRTSGRGGTACFFSGGVDSFHSVLAHRHEIDALLYVRGYDHATTRTPLTDEIRRRMHDAADQLELPLIEISTDLRAALSDRQRVGWPDYHGAGLAFIGHLLSPRFSRVLIPATNTYANLVPLGSHPLLDPWWSSERVEFVHDGADANRIEKLKAIAGHPAARQHLRVCWQNLEGRYNCGKCEKCIRTSVGALVAGVDQAFESLPTSDPRQVAAVRRKGSGVAWLELRDGLRRRHDLRPWRLAIEWVLLRERLSRVPLVGRWLR